MQTQKIETKPPPPPPFPPQRFNQPTKNLSTRTKPAIAKLLHHPLFSPKNLFLIPLLSLLSFPWYSLRTHRGQMYQPWTRLYSRKRLCIYACMYLCVHVLRIAPGRRRGHEREESERETRQPINKKKKKKKNKDRWIWTFSSSFSVLNSVARNEATSR